MNRLDGVSATRIALRLSPLGVTHVVATSDEFVRRLTRSPRFVPVWTSPPLTILALQPAPDRPPPPVSSPPRGRMSARLTGVDAEHLTFDLDAPAPVDATVAVAWSPKWHGRLDAAPVRLRPTGDGLIRRGGPRRTERTPPRLPG